ncbi:ATP-grasp domain-containing protein [Marimonas lutisalis]|uniref:ATP-grasp domain-containing protein n=1 Tax=Marimonas lutisalis TaxID=2545756 RepID=UPI0010F5AA65|nr:ATP-grasp domain-containing protein [Marimonas lutisalis]
MSGSDSRPVIAVSGLHRGESPQPGGAVIESVRAELPEARLIGISYDLMETGLHSVGPDRVDAAYLFPYPGAGPKEFIDRLRFVHEQENIALIIPTLDSELANLIGLYRELDEMGIKVLVPSAASLAGREKPALAELGQSANVPVPRTYAAQSADVLARCALEIGYPCYVKGALYDAKLVHHEGELFAAFKAIYDVWGGPVLLQQAVFGEEFVVAGIGDGKGGIVAQCALRKLLRTRLGKAFGGVVIDNPDMAEEAARLIRALKWEGPFEIEFVQPLGGKRYLFEINPRFPAWISFPAKLGCNMPAWAACKALGMRLPELQPCPPGKMFLRHCEDIVTDISAVADMSIDLKTERRQIDVAAGRDGDREEGNARHE